MFTTPSKYSSGSKYAWIILATVFFSSMAAPLNQFKVPPMIQQLSANLNTTLAEAGWLMSVFSIVAILLAIPAAFIIKRIGLKTSGILSMLFLITGSFLGSTATSTAFLLVSRLIEGTGLCLIAIVAPTAIAIWFPPEKRGAPLGIWGTWVPLGLVVMFSVSPWIGADSWIPVWQFGTGYSVAALVLFVLLFRLPADFVEQEEGTRESVFSIIKKRDIWLLAFAFAVQNIIRVILNTFLPNYLTVEHGISSVAANFAESLMMLVSMASGALVGYISDKCCSRKHFIAWPLLVLGILMYFPFNCPVSWINPLMAIMGFLIGLIPTCTFAAAPEIMKNPRNAGLGLAVVAVGQNIGMFLGPGLFGESVEIAGWVTSGNLIIPVCIAGFIAAILMRVR